MAIHQEIEVCFHVNGELIKKAALWTDKTTTVVQILELRSTNGYKPAWVPIYLHCHDQYYAARLEFIGVIAEIAYENANINTVDTSKENIFVRGSLDRRKSNYK